MASLTVRNLDESVKQALRERAAGNGRSMEEEVRLLLSGACEPAGIAGATAPAAVMRTPLPLEQASSAGLSVNEGMAMEPARFPGAGSTVLFIISGGIAAYKTLDLIRRLRERGVTLRVVMTRAAREFVTPLAVGALTAGKVFTDLFDREDEQDVGHIRLARECDLVLVAPATADLIAKMAHGLADDLASAVLLATDRPVLVAPAMNPAMWRHKATRRNLELLAGDGVHFIGPMEGEMAEAGEAGKGRMAEPLEIVAAIGRLLDKRPKPLAGRRAVVTSGPTHEPIDPVRYIANRSSGKQGHAIAAALADLGAEVTLVSGPVALADPAGVKMVRVMTAREMLEAVEAALPADIAVMVAAVADWRSKNAAAEKMKKQGGKGPATLELTENPDILRTVGHHEKRPELVVGFAAETENLLEHAIAKLRRKGADWILANDVSPEHGVMGGDHNRVTLLSRRGKREWPAASKTAIAERLARTIAGHLAQGTSKGKGKGKGKG